MAVTRTPEAIAQAAEQVKAEILQDIATGIMPFDVADFSDLHDHVDANEYGGFCDPDGRADWETDDWIEVQEIVHQWLVDGRPGTVGLRAWVPALAQGVYGAEWSPNCDFIIHLQAQQEAKRLGITWGRDMSAVDVILLMGAVLGIHGK